MSRSQQSEEAREALTQMQANLSALKREALVLIIDDSVNDCLILKSHILAVAPGTDVHFAHTESEASVLCQTKQYDLVFLDLIFPNAYGAVMLGSEWIKRVTNVIVMTGAESGSVPVEAARAAGAKLILPKPVDVDSLSLIFRRVPNGKPS